MMLGEVLEAYARQKRIPIRELATIVGIKWGTLFRIMKGESTSPRHVVALVCWLMSGSVPRKKNDSSTKINIGAGD